MSKDIPSRGQFLLEDYFIGRLMYGAAEFRGRYRMHKYVFMHIMADLCNHDNFLRQKPDGTGKLGLLPEQKMTAALRMLTYSAAVD